jgi:hypothetical protein
MVPPVRSVSRGQRRAFLGVRFAAGTIGFRHDQGGLVKRCARTGGVVVGVAAAVAGLLWLLKNRMSGPPRIPLDEPSPFPAPSPVPAAPPDVPDDLSDVTGIGPVYRTRLAEAGIATFAALSAADPATVAGHAGVTERMAADWINQASDLARR